MEANVRTGWSLVLLLSFTSCRAPEPGLRFRSARLRDRQPRSWHRLRQRNWADPTHVGSPVGPLLPRSHGDPLRRAWNGRLSVAISAFRPQGRRRKAGGDHLFAALLVADDGDAGAEDVVAVSVVAVVVRVDQRAYGAVASLERSRHSYVSLYNPPVPSIASLAFSRYNASKGRSG